MQEDRAKCLSCDMDDFLAKPLRMDQLAEALEKVHPRSEDTSSHPTTTPP